MTSSRPEDLIRALIKEGLIVLLKNSGVPIAEAETEAERRLTVQAGQKAYEGYWVSNGGFVAGNWLCCSPTAGGDQLLEVIQANLSHQGWQCRAVNGYLNFKPIEATLAERLRRFEDGLPAGDRRLPPGMEDRLAYARYRLNFLKQRLSTLGSNGPQKTPADLEAILATDLFHGLSEWLAEPDSDKGLKQLIDWTWHLNRTHDLGRCSEAQRFGLYKIATWAMVQLSQDKIIIEG